MADLHDDLAGVHCGWTDNVPGKTQTSLMKLIKEVYNHDLAAVRQGGGGVADHSRLPTSTRSKENTAARIEELPHWITDSGKQTSQMKGNGVDVLLNTVAYADTMYAARDWLHS